LSSCRAALKYVLEMTRLWPLAALAKVSITLFALGATSVSIGWERYSKR
jgi:hypothetical protein